MQSASFLADQRHLEIGHGRSNCQSVFGMRKIARDGQVRVMLDTVARRNLPRCSAIFWR